MNAEHRYSVTFCVLLGKSRQQTMSMIQDTYGATALTRTRIYEWYNTFEKDPTRDAADRPRAGRPNIASGKAGEIATLYRADKRLTVRDIALKLALGTASVHDSITTQLNMSKVCAR